MKIGFQTIVWWPFADGIEYMLDVIQAAGFKGVEFKQRPRQKETKEQLPDELCDIDILQRLLKERGLDLLGLAGGSLEERMTYCGNVRPQYLYIEGWDEDTEKLYEKSKDSPSGEFSLALHPHVFQPTQSLRVALQLLKEHPNLKFLPDTAHLKIAGDLEEATKNLYTYKNRIAAVHIKDWTPEFGRSVHRYARGFVELGYGDVDLDGVLKILKSIGYNGWLVVEQDYTKTDPALSTWKCSEWLAERGLITKTGRSLPSRVRQVRKEREDTISIPKLGVATVARFLEAVVSAGWQDIKSCYDSIAQAFLVLLNCELVTFWTCSPAHDLINLVAVKDKRDRTLPLKNILNYHNSLSGDTIERQRIQHWNLDDLEIVPRFALSELLTVIDSRWMTSIPVFNPWNPNHVRLVINIFHESEYLQASDCELFRLGIAIGHATSSALDEVGSTGTASVNAIVSKGKRVKDFVEELVDTVAFAMDCEEVAVFLMNPTENQLDLVGYNGSEWKIGGIAKWYEAAEKNIIRLLENEEQFIMPRDWWEIVEEVERLDFMDRRTCTGTPFVMNDGTFLGFVSCCGKRAHGQLNAYEKVVFSDDDDAILEAIVQAAVPHLEVLAAQERREKALSRLTHELKVPVVAIRGATELMMGTEGISDLLDYDWLGDIWSWSELMRRLLDNADVLSYALKGLPINASATNLLRDVIAPAVRQVRLLLVERGFSQKKIHYTKEKFQRFPVLWLDRNRFQQVMFNLLSNAIKYAYDDADAFLVEIIGSEGRDEFIIRFRDWGRGIKSGAEELIFEDGFRCQDAVDMDVAGQGLGLWVVRQVVQGHGGHIEVTRLNLPTEFRISLPYSLTSWSPAQRLGEY